MIQLLLSACYKPACHESCRTGSNQPPPQHIYTECQATNRHSKPQPHQITFARCSHPSWPQQHMYPHTVDCILTGQPMPAPAPPSPSCCCCKSCCCCNPAPPPVLPYPPASVQAHHRQGGLPQAMRQAPAACTEHAGQSSPAISAATMTPDPVPVDDPSGPSPASLGSMELEGEERAPAPGAGGAAWPAPAASSPAAAAAADASALTVGGTLLPVLGPVLAGPAAAGPGLVVARRSELPLPLLAPAAPGLTTAPLASRAASCQLAHDAMDPAPVVSWAVGSILPELLTLGAELVLSLLPLVAAAVAAAATKGSVATVEPAAFPAAASPPLLPDDEPSAAAMAAAASSMLVAGEPGGLLLPLDSGADVPAARGDLGAGGGATRGT
mmetsp:Transcript_37698/g.95303  ORF Transcript_37698/g.95303 Transcript_37698/m.95303 type:complete len:384 (-) Transcript_37698:287-1438(-)